jgi:type I restriction enzyme, R subunit
MNEADTCRTEGQRKPEAAGWDQAPHVYNEQVCLTDGRIIVAGGKVLRREHRPMACLAERLDFEISPTSRRNSVNSLIRRFYEAAYGATP